MKKRDKQKVINYAVKYYGDRFRRNYKPTYINKKQVKDLLKEYPHSSMYEWSYCCYGLYQNCWQEIFEEGNWGMSQERVNEIILDIFKPNLLKKCRVENRMFCCEKNDMIHLLIIARDLYRDDYLITFSKTEY